MCLAETPAPNAASRSLSPTGSKPNSNRTSYLWHCRACDYTFEAMAIFEEREPVRTPLAA